MLDVDVNRRALPRSARVAVAAALVALAMPLAGLQLFAQAATARLSGVVTDQSGAPVADAHVDVIDQQTQARRSMTTDNSGRYVFLDLTPGAWRVASEAMGFKPALQGVTLSPGQAATQDLRLEVGSVQETITIGARRDEPGHRPPADEQIVVKMRQAAKAGSITPPMRTATANPVYPPALMNAGIGDRIVLDARIGTDGSVVDIKVRSSQNPELLKVAMDAVNQWKYTPTLLHGKPVEVEMQVTFDFNPPKPGQK